MKEYRGSTFIWISVVLLICYGVVWDSEWSGSTELHTIMETVATGLALGAGIMALVRFYSRKTSLFLFVGTGFLGTGFLDGYHAVVTSSFFKRYLSFSC